jgi:nicotinate-nucleotide adenylyltransferase
VSSEGGHRIGLLGGTFDPIHAGHLAAAHVAVSCARLDRVLFVPAGQPPHRPPAVASAQERLEMCKLAIAGESRFEVSDIELRRSGPSYTVATLADLRSRAPGAGLFLILGWDAARLFPTWHRPEDVRALASILVIGRPGAGALSETDLQTAGLGGEGVTLCLEPTPDISASDIRRAVAAGESISDKVAAAVERYIAANRLYAG